MNKGIEAAKTLALLVVAACSVKIAIDVAELRSQGDWVVSHITIISDNTNTIAEPR